MALASLLFNRVTITRYGPPVNVGGVNVPEATVIPDVPCNIQQAAASSRFGQDVEGASASGRAFFGSDPGVSVNDILDFGGRTLLVTAPAFQEIGGRGPWRVEWSEVL
jgi:hypothetical protein